MTARLLPMLTLAIVLQTGRVGVAAESRMLLRDAFDATQAIRTDKGGWWSETLVLLRIADTMRMHGFREDALQALRACRE